MLRSSAVATPEPRHSAPRPVPASSHALPTIQSPYAWFGQSIMPSCIYCGTSNATDRDHVPPRCFFPRLPTDAITVPSCRDCNKNYGKDDERVRNLLTSLASTETHPAVQGQVSVRRDRALNRDVRERSGSHVKHLLDSIVPVEVRTPAGLYLAKRYAFQLDQPLLDRFFSRLTRALLWHESSVRAENCAIEWRKAPSPSAVGEMPPKLKAFLLHGRHGSVGGDVFRYVGFLRQGSARSLWLFSFYDGVEVMTLCRCLPEKRA